MRLWDRSPSVTPQVAHLNIDKNIRLYIIKIMAYINKEYIKPRSPKTEGEVYINTKYNPENSLYEKEYRYKEKGGDDYPLYTYNKATYNYTVDKYTTSVTDLYFPREPKSESTSSIALSGMIHHFEDGLLNNKPHHNTVDERLASIVYPEGKKSSDYPNIKTSFPKDISPLKCKSEEEVEKEVKKLNKEFTEKSNQEFDEHFSKFKRGSKFKMLGVEYTVDSVYKNDYTRYYCDDGIDHDFYLVESCDKPDPYYHVFDISKGSFLRGPTDIRHYVVGLYINPSTNEILKKNFYIDDMDLIEYESNITINNIDEQTMLEFNDG
jgi:hypothetical protein